MASLHTTPRKQAKSPTRWAGYSPALRAGVLLGISAVLMGCFGPDYNAIANRLRREKIDDDRQIAGLKQQVAERDAAIKNLQATLAAKNPPLPTLPPERLAQLFTATRLELRSQTDVWDFGDGKGVSGFRVFLRTYAEGDEIIPATGELTIEAFELPDAPAQPRRIGTWTFTAQEMKKNWYTGLGSDYFAINCPWQARPTLSKITFKARLVDALTGRILEAQLDKSIKLPP